jgi:hypothetical protein
MPDFSGLGLGSRIPLKLWRKEGLGSASASDAQQPKVRISFSQAVQTLDTSQPKTLTVYNDNLTKLTG